MRPRVPPKAPQCLSVLAPSALLSRPMSRCVMWCMSKNPTISMPSTALWKCASFTSSLSNLSALLRRIKRPLDTTGNTKGKTTSAMLSDCQTRYTRFASTLSSQRKIHLPWINTCTTSSPSLEHNRLSLSPVFFRV